MLKWLPIFVLLIQMQQKGREFVFDRMTFHANEKTVYKTTDGNKFSHGNVAGWSDIIRHSKTANFRNKKTKIMVNRIIQKYRNLFHAIDCISFLEIIYCINIWIS